MLLPGEISIWVRVIIIAIAVPGAIFLLLGIQRLFRRRILSGIAEGTVGLILLLIAVSGVMISIHLNTYNSLIGESRVVTVCFSKKGDGSLSFADVDFQKFGVFFDGFLRKSWRLDVRVLEFHGLPALIGYKTLFRIQCFSDRYWDAYVENNEPYMTFKSPEEGLDLWAIARRHPRWIPWVKATRKSTEFMPIVKGAYYTVSIDNTGLIVRPINEIARKAVAHQVMGSGQAK